MENDFRLISILPAPSKIVKRLITNQIGQSLRENIYESQYAFCRSYNATILLLSLRENTNTGKLCALVSLNLSKALNSICHAIVMRKFKDQFSFSKTYFLVL